MPSTSSKSTSPEPSNSLDLLANLHILCTKCNKDIYFTLKGEWRHHCGGRFLASGCGFAAPKENQRAT